MEEVVYKVVGKDVKVYKTEEELLSEHKMIKRSTATWVYEWLQNQPVLEGLVGPFGDSGPLASPKVVRYETPELYELLSR